MTRSMIARVVLVIGLVCSATVGLPAPMGADLMLPSVGRSAGTNDSMWYTTLWIHNPRASPAQVSIALLIKSFTNGESSRSLVGRVCS